MRFSMQSHKEDRHFQAAYVKMADGTTAGTHIATSTGQFTIDIKQSRASLQSTCKPMKEFSPILDVFSSREGYETAPERHSCLTVGE